MTTVRFSAPLKSVFIEEGYDAILFLSPPAEAAEAISAHELERRLELGKRRGFGSVKVTARIGASEWSTSVFPKDGSWFLPVKKPVRLAEDLAEGEIAEVELDLI